MTIERDKLQGINPLCKETFWVKVVIAAQTGASPKTGGYLMAEGITNAGPSSSSSTTYDGLASK